ncbi:DUF4142 domain-containing protein [Duganella aceris]|uniref:DUF4142 domain-containing protein n=1 Tax=Duganella aceris TaxID=2703883 RepID=A0ABX0FDR1_9BURK|nr:DUF4142 domain-containing protein [Duganella aceris]NGZ82863.1 DUF4142 domain-containing protein [Duganella aceris]
MNNKTLRGIALALALLGATAAHAQGLSRGDQKILRALAQANMAEVAAGHIALKRSTTQDVKAFAQQMVDDHTKGLQAVQEVAQSKNFTLPTEPDAKHKKMAARLDKLSGAAFDKVYLANAGVSDHKAAYQQVVEAQKKAADPDVKALAAKLQPTIDHHLQKVQVMVTD